MCTELRQRQPRPTRHHFFVAAKLQFDAVALDLDFTLWLNGIARVGVSIVVTELRFS